MLTVSRNEKNGCPCCDFLRRRFKNPQEFCLKHDPAISEEWRRVNKIPYEPLKQTNEKEPTRNVDGK